MLLWVGFEPGSATKPTKAPTLSLDYLEGVHWMPTSKGGNVSVSGGARCGGAPIGAVYTSR